MNAPYEAGRSVVPHPLEQGPPVMQIDDLRTFGPHRLRACLLSATVEQRERATASVDRFVDQVNVVAVRAMTRGRGPVSVRFWVDAHSLVATVADRRDGFDRIVSVSPVLEEAPRQPQP